MRWRLARLNWAYGLGELIIVVAGVLVALAVDDWRQSRVSVATERYILDGILTDLRRDREDIESSISAASARAAAADKLLADVGSAAAGKVQLTPWVSTPGQLDPQLAFERARVKYPRNSLSVASALRMLTAVGSMQRVDVSSATFDEASASGELETIRDTGLRAALGQYYYRAAKFGATTDQRVDNNWLHLRDVLATGGLSSGSLTSEEVILRILDSDDVLIAEVTNARELAANQIVYNTLVLESANDLTLFVERALQGRALHE